MSAAAQEMLRRHPEITAFVAPQEHRVAVLRAAQAQARRIPDDLSLVAMLSDTSSELATPPLTTISLPRMSSETSRLGCCWPGWSTIARIPNRRWCGPTDHPRVHVPAEEGSA